MISVITSVNKGAVLVMDGEINQISATIPIGEYPQGIAVNPNTNSIYVTKPSVNRILLIDDKTNEVILPRNIIFNVSPTNSITIDCNGVKIITNQSLLIKNLIYLLEQNILQLLTMDFISIVR
jgi:DNA-binding beta-propeller fold protein YncE